ncbi:hypothetical protein H5410_048175 [Solanum commersonii]|uniref:Uncharacterized protein n=1 Tax=Solanum commersonii TaxID=4109 RepID=A0A9J5XJ12_SOLCO|nr:hypothetical protein H5410_048175 [Solanum commersonii]
METAVRLVNAYMVEGVLLLIVIVAIKVLAISFKHTKPILPSLVRETFEDHEPLLIVAAKVIQKNVEILQLT